jgi:hypothetical protein
MMDALSETQPGRRVDRRQLAAIGRWLAISLVSGPVVATCVVARRPATGRYFDALPHSSPSGPTARLSGLSGCHPPNSCLSCPCLAANAAVYGVNHHVVAISQACAPCQSGDIPRSQVCPEKE